MLQGLPFTPAVIEQLCDPGRARSACEFGVLHCCDTDMIHAGVGDLTAQEWDSSGISSQVASDYMICP